MASKKAITTGVPIHPADAMLHARLAAATHGISPMAVATAWSDWLLHLQASPSKQMACAESAVGKFYQWLCYLPEALTSHCRPCIEPIPKDPRFQQAAWDTPPFNWISQGFLLYEQWCREAVTGIRGVSAHDEHLIEFMTRQWLDMWSPSNGILTNPEVLALTAKTGGANLAEGFGNWARDAVNLSINRPPAGTEQFIPGKTVACTPGKVVFRNHLIELIQYTAQTPNVYPEPVLIVPSWIMKYYILDLSPDNSLVKYLVQAGFTVLMISWKNPDAGDSDLTMEDYLRQGIMAALDQVSAGFPRVQMHAVGYCLGGTMLAIAAASLARQHDERIKSITLLAATLDFEEPGELGLFIDESQICFLEDTMAEKGYLDGQQMGGAFALINSKDLVWSKLVFEYLKGEKTKLSDLRAWNADATRMPCRMHSEYLRRLYLNNELADGAYVLNGDPIALNDILQPLFVVGTERDHVSPWKSVYKVHRLTDAKITFVLTTGGHNVGIVNPPNPGADHRGYRIDVKLHESDYIDPDIWYEATAKSKGSWWPAWQLWLISLSGEQVKAATAGELIRQAQHLGDAPGAYVFAR